MSVDKHIQREKKLLALSKSSNVHEAALALEHAQRLMQEQGLSMTDVRMFDVKSHVVPMAKAKTPANHIQNLSQLIAGAFGCELFVTSQEVGWGKWESKVCFIGIESAAELAGYAFDVLRRQLERDRREHLAGLKRCSPTTKTRRADAFCSAWVWQIRGKVAKLAVSAEHESAIAAWLQRKHPDLEDGKRRRSAALGPRDFSSVKAGIGKGEEAQLYAGVGACGRKRLS